MVGLTAVHIFFPQRNGPVALTQVFAPYLFLPLLLLAPFLLLRDFTPFRVLFLICVLLFMARYLPRLSLSEPAPNPDAPRLSVMSWNMRISNRRYGEIFDLLKTKPADVVALIEPTEQWYYDQGLSAIYPFRRGTPPNNEPTGVILFSVYPILEDGVIDDNSTSPQDRDIVLPRKQIRSQWARLDLGQGRTITVVAAHPYPPSPPIQPCPNPQPLCYDTSQRDAQISAIRAFIGPLLDRGEPLILAGDFNVTDREPGYRDLTAGLRDAHLEVGSGTGSTWRPDFLLNRELPILRIDYQFSSSNVRPLHASTDCTLRGSDHCIIYGTFEIGQIRR